MYVSRALLPIASRQLSVDVPCFSRSHCYSIVALLQIGTSRECLLQKVLYERQLLMQHVKHRIIQFSLGYHLDLRDCFARRNSAVDIYS
jgi:hypothetical protein